MASGASEGSYSALVRPLQPLQPEIDGDTHKKAGKEGKQGVADNKAISTEDEPDDELQRPSKDKERGGGWEMVTMGRKRGKCRRRRHM